METVDLKEKKEVKLFSRPQHLKLGFLSYGEKKKQSLELQMMPKLTDCYVVLCFHL